MKSSMFSHYITQLLFYIQCFAFAIVCVLSLNTVSGDTSSDVSCDGDSGDGICQYEGYLYEETCGDRNTTSCIIYTELETRQITIRCSHQTERTCKVIGSRYTFWIQGETGPERRDRIVRTVDSHVVQQVELLSEACKLVDGEDNPAGIYGRTFCAEINGSEELEIAGAIEGLTTPVYGDHLEDLAHKDLEVWLVRQGFYPHEDRKKLERVAGVFIANENTQRRRIRKGSIYIDIDNIENFFKEEGEIIWDLETVETDIHERLHLADWIDNGEVDWASADHNDFDEGEKDDRIYRQAGELIEEIGNSGVEWSRTCPDPYQVLWKLPGWGLEMTDPNYCRIGEVREVLRRR
ncbi:MAG: hypothetical protein OXO49_09075 [Gammaproteobacteria bacterium]|nr:hypothetical protein [Gammaproteobacteria bacterium]MDE0252732.1 hypothetical protein [Gammaproteobacteria bacterium]MDE0402253.1 hypothetical protein [Gammaproteobacteria bacterium]